MEVARSLVLLVLLGVNTALDCVRKKIFFWVCVVGIVLGSLLQIWKGGLEWRNFGVGIFVAAIVGTIIGIMSATFTQVIILLLSGTVNFNVILSTLIPFYLFISIMEGILNIMFITTISKIKPEIMST